MSITLITQARAKKNINQTTFTAADNDTIDAMIAGYSAGFTKYLGREIQAAGYDDLLSGDLQPWLFLAAMPILSVSRVASGSEAAITIKNTSWPTNTRATVQVLATGLRLVRVASGTTTVDETVTWSSNTTLNAVVTAVNALGNGWSATLALDSNWGTWASEDLRPIQGALNVANSAEADLLLFTEEYSDYDVDEKIGALYRADGWPRGNKNVRAVYSAGFEDVPEDMQEACAIMVSGAYWQTKRDPMSMSTKTADFTYNAGGTFQLPWPANVLRMLAPYKLRNL